jgi:large subunit ribosomal protein L9
MKVIFLEDVPNVGRAGEIKEVADGYGRNFLIPRKLALLASPESVKSVGVKLRVQARGQVQTEAELVEVANQLDGKEISLEARSGSKDRLYGSITTADIAAELEKAFGLVVDKRKIELDEPIHELGSYEIEIRLAKDIVPKIKVTVTGESAPMKSGKKSGRPKKKAG